MKSLFLMSLVCATAGLLAMVSLSAVTVVPRPGAELSRSWLMMLVSVLLVGWIALAIWASWRWRKARQSLPPLWLRGMLIFVGVVYLLAMAGFFLG